MRPTGLNTVEMLKIASRGLGIGPHQAMCLAERLYMQVRSDVSVWCCSSNESGIWRYSKAHTHAEETNSLPSHAFCTQGYISYPRTESTGYPPGSDLLSTLRPHRAHPAWGDAVAELLAAGTMRPRPGVDAGDHPPITPMRGPGPSGPCTRPWRLVSHGFPGFDGAAIWARKALSG